MGNSLKVLLFEFKLSCAAGEQEHMRTAAFVLCLFVVICKPEFLTCMDVGERSAGASTASIYVFEDQVKALTRENEFSLFLQGIRAARSGDVQLSIVYQQNSSTTPQSFTLFTSTVERSDPFSDVDAQFRSNGTAQLGAGCGTITSGMI